MNNLVTFNENQISVIDYDNQKWLTSVDIAKALNFAKPNAVTKIYNNHKSEFDGGLSCLPKSGKQRIFNREGAWLVGMFARTPKAAEFRKWVLKVLGAVADNQVPAIAQVDMKAIGGMVKRCAAAAVRDELQKAITDDFETQNWLQILATGLKLRTNNMLKEQYAELIAENQELKERLGSIKLLAQ